MERGRGIDVRRRLKIVISFPHALGCSYTPEVDHGEFSSSDSDEELHGGKFIDHAPYRYSIESQLGAGAFAQVSLATRTMVNSAGGAEGEESKETDIMESDSEDEDAEKGEQFALKRLSLPMSCLSEEERTEAITEVHVLSTLVHPNILQYEDSFLDSGALHIVMEYVTFAFEIVVRCPVSPCASPSLRNVPLFGSCGAGSVLFVATGTPRAAPSNT